MRGSFSGDDLKGRRTPCRPKRSPLCTILRYPFLADGPEKIFERGARAEITQFFGQNFPKSA